MAQPLVFRREALRHRSWKLLAELNIHLPVGDYVELRACVTELVQVDMFRFSSRLNRLLLKYNSWLILGSDLWLSRYKITIVASSFA